MRNAIRSWAWVVVLAVTSLPALAQEGCMLRPAPGTHVPPPYPRAAQRLGERGTVDLHVTVAPQGASSSAAIARSSGSKRLDEAVLENVQFWLTQTRRGCTPRQMIVRISYELTRGKDGFIIWRW